MTRTHQPPGRPGPPPGRLQPSIFLLPLAPTQRPHSPPPLLRALLMPALEVGMLALSVPRLLVSPCQTLIPSVTDATHFWDTRIHLQDPA